MVELVLNGGHHRQMLEAHTGETPKTRNVETQGLVATKKGITSLSLKYLKFRKISVQQRVKYLCGMESLQF